MSEPVIPDISPAVADLPPSPAVVEQRSRVSLAAEAVYVVGQASCRGKEAERMVALLRYLDTEYQAECAALDSLLATEALGKPVAVTNGSTLSLAPAPAN